MSERHIIEAFNDLNLFHGLMSDSTFIPVSGNDRLTWLSCNPLPRY